MDKPHIILNIPEGFPEIAIEKITEDITDEKLLLKVNKVPTQPLASIEWAIPGLIAIFIAQSYFGGFLSELGKDHYDVLKKWIKENAIRSRTIKVKTLTASRSVEKIDKSNTQSKAFSLHFNTVDGKNIKLLFDLTLEDEVWENSIEKFMDLIRENYTNFPNDILSSKLNDLENGKSNIYGIINPDTKEWEFFDIMNKFFFIVPIIHSYL